MTDKVTLTSASEWVAIGTAPALVSNAGAFAVYLQVETSLPAADEFGHSIGPGETISFGGSGTIYARLREAALGPIAMIITPNASSTRGSGPIDANTQRVTLATDGAVVTAIGSTADAVAAADGSGAPSIIAMLKRGVVSWQSLLSRVPAMVANLTPVKTLLAPGACYALTTAATTANQALSAGIKALSIYARNSDAYFAIGNGAQTATASKIFIAAGERLDFDVTGYASPNIACIFGPSGAAAILHIVELS